MKRAVPLRDLGSLVAQCECSQRDLAKLCGVSQSTLSRLARGRDVRLTARQEVAIRAAVLRATPAANPSPIFVLSGPPDASISFAYDDIAVVLLDGSKVEVQLHKEGIVSKQILQNPSLQVSQQVRDQILREWSEWLRHKAS